MCGLVGVFSCSNGCNGVSSKLSAALSVLQHRGPDNAGSWVSPDGTVGLGHVRLSINGLEDGSQPLHSHSGKTVAVVNGELYDHRRIRQELQDSYQFQTGSDSEILIALYEKYGVDCISKLRGEFSFALYDREKNRLFVARDRFGIKPLYYGEHNGQIFFSSEIKGLLALGMTPVWDQHAYISRSFYLGDRTLFSGIRSVPPGHYMVCEANGQRRTVQYWDWDFPELHSEGPSISSESDWISALNDRILESLDLRLQADVPVAFYLSGGLDSSILLAMGTKLAGPHRAAFNLSFVDDPRYDENASARAVAQHTEANLQTIEVRDDDLSDNFEKAIFHNEVPFFNGHGIAKFLLSAAVRRAGYKVVITGEGADEVFGGYPHFRRDVALSPSSNGHNGSGTNGHSVAAMAKSYTCGLDLDPYLIDAVGHEVSWIENQRGMVHRVHALYNASTINYHKENPPFREFVDGMVAKGPRKDRHRLHTAMYLWAKSFLPNFVLTTLGDRMEMANAIEGRIPFLDHNVAELMAAVPVNMKIRDNVEKYILREVALRYLPRSLAYRKKHYFRSPPSVRHLNTRMYTMVQDLLRSSSSTSVPFFSAVAIRELLDKLPTLSPDDLALLDPVLMEISSLCMIQKIFGLSA